jgi:hypothetical protein
MSGTGDWKKLRRALFLLSRPVTVRPVGLKFSAADPQY